MSRKPKNFLLIMTDQQRSTDAFSPKNQANLDLPAMKRLKKYGTNYTQAVCNSCMCSPSRSTLFTGRYPAQHDVTQTLTYGGVFSPSQPTLDPDIPNLANIFARHGYDVQYRGKWHLSKSPVEPDNPDALTSQDVSLFGFQGWVPPDAGEDAEPVHFGGGWPNTDARYIEEAKAYLKARRDGDDDTPFVLVLSLVNPHDVLGYPSRWEYGYSVDDFKRGKRAMELPESWDEDLADNNKPKAQPQLKATMAVSLGPLVKKEKKENYLNFYATLIEKIDCQINGLLDLFFDEHGKPNDFFNDTMILRTADHGEMGMAHGGLRQKAFNVYEETLRVPMIWSNPRVFSGDQTSDSLVSLVDVVPTVVSFFLDNKVKPDTLDAFAGRDMSRTFHDPDAFVQAQTLFTYDDIRASSGDKLHVVLAPDRIRCVRTKDWKYAEYFSADSTYAPEYELYDLRKPTVGNEAGQNGLEYDNLYYDRDGNPNPRPEIKTKVKEMQALLQEQMNHKLHR